ncbi:hypothetical protein [Lachnoclostridium phytofermentans]|uniref:anti-sigma-I factor RsgI family protein n=1 Tax=Lachnoclostridium phytofermentans TaxID=66219 RepID=UPI000691D531|nr:hypothetical protein [Lachnoclostridium phytofermentans]
MKTKTVNKKLLSIGIITTTLFVLVMFAIYLLAPSRYLALDINPSVEFRLNRLGQVVSVHAVNEDAKVLLKDYHINDHSLEAVLDDISILLVNAGYLGSHKENDILITVEKTSDSTEILSKVNAIIEKVLNQNQISATILTQSIDINQDLTLDANQNQISAGKMAIIKRLLAQDPSLTPKELSETKLSDLLAYAVQNNLTIEELADQLDDLDDLYGDDIVEALEESIDDLEDMEDANVDDEDNVDNKDDFDVDDMDDSDVDDMDDSDVDDMDDSDMDDMDDSDVDDMDDSDVDDMDDSDVDDMDDSDVDDMDDSDVDDMDDSDVDDMDDSDVDDMDDSDMDERNYFDNNNGDDSDMDDMDNFYDHDGDGSGVDDKSDFDDNNGDDSDVED